MSEPTSVVNLGELSKPATVLVEKISDAVGGVFRPYQVVRMARAEAEAERIRAEAAIEITDLQRRAFIRFLHEEARKQSNIEGVTRLVLPQLDSTAQPEQIDDDWLANFFDKCRLTSDYEMQQLWSRVLAGQANTPGRFSRRTVDFVASLDKTEADRFTALCCFCWTFPGATEPLTPVIFDLSDAVYENHGVTFDTVKDLDALGLIRFQSIGGFRRTSLAKQVLVSYFGNHAVLTLPEESNNHVRVGTVLLTRTGQELAAICGALQLDGFFEYTLNKWRDQGVVATALSVDPAAG